MSHKTTINAEIRNKLIVIINDIKQHNRTELQSDYKELMKKIEEGLKHHFKADNNDDNSYSNNNSNNISDNKSELETISPLPQNIQNIAINEEGEKEKKAFVRVNAVMRNSPAEMAGLKVNDEILEFGNVNARTADQLLGIRDLVLANENKFINILLRRDGSEKSVRLKPSKWPGNGLLGFVLIFQLL